jgi:hypothetical protein
MRILHKPGHELYNSPITFQVMALFAATAVYRNDAAGMRLEGSPAVRAGFTKFFTAMPDVRWAVTRCMVVGQSAIDCFLAGRGTSVEGAERSAM